MDTKAIVEAAKEALRIAFFAALTALVAWGTQSLTSVDPSSTFYIVGTVALRLADKFVHENKDIKVNGIAPI